MLIHLPFITLPLVLLIWIIDCWLLLSIITGLFYCFPGENLQCLSDKLPPLASALPKILRSCSEKYFNKRLSLKYYWLFAILAVSVLRHLLMLLLFYLGHPS